MYVVVHHDLIDPPTAFARGERLKSGESAPSGARALQFYPSDDGSAATCLWEANSVADVQTFVDETLGEDFPLWEVIEKFDTEQEFVEELKQHRERQGTPSESAPEATPVTSDAST